MSDDKTKQDYRDDSKISRDEVAYWAKKFNVTTKEIIDAIAATESNSVKKIEAYLKKPNSRP